MTNYGCKGLTALITGGTSGIGLATAKLLLADGAQVIIVGRACGNGLKLEDELQGQFGTKVNFIACDITVSAERRALAQEVKNRALQVDLLVNCAGIYTEQRLEHLTEEDFTAMFALNVGGTIFMTKELLPLLARQAAIVNVASDAGISGNYGCAAYCASKGAVVAFTKALALDLAPGVRVNCVCPADVLTPLLEKQIQLAGGSYTLEDVAAVYPMGRVGKASEIAHVICSLLSPLNSFMTGAVIPVDGGLTAK